ncbi:DNA adenine methylase [Helicobacter sp. 11S02629-2]|uniref:DNA adenine methylase n=1 Tax=Helicobacter sp. 11S02629-2 TaxID=1476195 RepID=UPI0021519DE9|nr:DNA adenine methylase [Helicobacter sp. 11S02629-2]
MQTYQNDTLFLTPTTLKPPFAWVGGKSRLAKDIVAMMPPHQTYVEVFAGGLNVLYAKGLPSDVSTLILGGGGVKLL